VAYLRGPGHGLDEGEWIAYWKVFPHSLTGRLTSEATHAVAGPTGEVVATFDAGKATMMKVVLGIVDWNLIGSDGQPVKWTAAQARELVDGLPPETFLLLAQIISTDAPVPALSDPVDDEPNAETVGNASGES
jgi:hypothetical protein